MIKSAVKADLIFDAALTQRVDHLFDPGRIVVDGLFAEYMFSCPDRFHRNRGMGVGRRADQDSVYFRIGKYFPVAILRAQSAVSLLIKGSARYVTFARAA